MYLTFKIQHAHASHTLLPHLQSLSSTAPGYSCRPLMKSGTKAFSGSSSFLDLISGMNYLLLASKESKAHPNSLPTLNLWGTSRKSTSSSSLHIISSRRILTLINSATLSLYWYGLSHGTMGMDMDLLLNRTMWNEFLGYQVFVLNIHQQHFTL